MVRMSHWAVVVAAIPAFLVSAVWYIGFGNELAKLSAAYADTQSPPGWKMLAEFFRTLIVAYMLACFAMPLGINDWKDALRLGA